MAKHNLTKSQLIAQYKDKDKLITASNKAHLLLTLGVLWDIFNFTKEDMDLFMDKYEELLSSYNDGNEDINEWQKNLTEVVGIQIL